MEEQNTPSQLLTSLIHFSYLFLFIVCFGFDSFFFTISTFSVLGFLVTKVLKGSNVDPNVTAATKDFEVANNGFLLLETELMRMVSG
jgi:hypothetical protein